MHNRLLRVCTVVLLGMVCAVSFSMQKDDTWNKGWLEFQKSIFLECWPILRGQPTIINKNLTKLLITEDDDTRKQTSQLLVNQSYDNKNNKEIINDYINIVVNYLPPSEQPKCIYCDGDSCVRYLNATILALYTTGRIGNGTKKLVEKSLSAAEKTRKQATENIKNDNRSYKQSIFKKILLFVGY